MAGYGRQEFEDRYPKRHGYRKDVNEEIVKRIASMTAWQIRKDRERENQKFLRDLMIIAVSLIVGFVVGYHRGKGFGF